MVLPGNRQFTNTKPFTVAGSMLSAYPCTNQVLMHRSHYCSLLPHILCSLLHRHRCHGTTSCGDAPTELPGTALPPVIAHGGIHFVIQTTHDGRHITSTVTLDKGCSATNTSCTVGAHTHKTVEPPPSCLPHHTSPQLLPALQASLNTTTTLVQC